MFLEKPSYEEVLLDHDKTHYSDETYLARCVRILGVERYWGSFEDWVRAASGTLEVLTHLEAGGGISLPEEIDNIRRALGDVPSPRWEEIVAKHFKKPWRYLCLALLPEIDDSFPLYKLLFPEYLLDRPSQEITEEKADVCVHVYYNELANTITSIFGNRTITHATFSALFSKIFITANQLKQGATGGSFSIKVVNQLSNTLNTGPDVLLNFLRSIFDSVVEALLQNRIVSQCQFCGDYFKYIREKKYCSLKSEPKNCAGKAADQRYYAKHGEEIRKKNRKRMRQIRAKDKKLSPRK